MNDSSVERMRLTQSMDQSSAGLIEFAATLAAYMKALMSEGFSRREAMDLVASYQLTLFSSALDQGKRQRDQP